MNNFVNRILGLLPYLKGLMSRLCILIISAIILNSCTTYRAERLKNKSYKEWKAHQWKQEKQYEENGQTWTSFSRKVRGTNFKEFKITGEIDVPPKKAVKVLRTKAENGQDYMDKEEGYMEVLCSSESEAVIYSVYNMPFPFKDRAMCERFSFIVEEQSGTHRISWIEDWDMAPGKNEKVINMSLTRGSWEFEPVGQDRSLATYVVLADPGGSIPAWMVNATVEKGLLKELRSLEIIAQDLK